MKKILVLLTSLVYIQTILAQWTTSGANIYNSNSGNVGIGTTTPGLKLDINGSAQIYPSANKGASGALTLRFMPGTNASIIEANSNIIWADHDIIINAANSTGGNTDQLVVHRSGKIGIGTATPSTILELKSLTPIITLSPSNYASTYRTTLGTRSGAEAFLIFGNNGQNEIRAGNSNAGGYLDFYTNNTVDQSQASNGILTMRLTANGNVGIGTIAPGPYKLAVEGTIAGRKVKVTQATPWADYVFNDDYPLMSLKELDDYIHQHKHLPDVLSATEVEKNGLDLGENQAVLLKKIEELTLYVINQQKQIDELKNELRDLKPNKN